MRPASLLLVLGSLLAAASCGAGEESTRVVLITVDTLRADSLTPADMPRTSEFAHGGALFERAYAATSTTQPTHASLLTGLHPWQHGVTRNGEVLAEGRATVAETLKKAGFETSAVVSSFPMHRSFGWDQGFDHYDDEFDVPYVRVWEGQELEGGRFYSLAASVTDAALTALDEARGERQFFWFHYFDPHDPYGDTPSADAPAPNAMSIGALLGLARKGDPSARAAAEEARRLYDRDVARLDAELGRLLERLQRDAGRIATHVILTSDHGESFGEAGCLGHGKRLTHEQVAVPLLVVSPRVVSGARRDAAGSVDVAATLLALAAVPPDDPGRRALAGRDLTRPDETGRAFGMRRTFSEPRDELLLDGSKLEVSGPRFFAVHEGRLLTGDGESVLVGDVPGAFLDEELAEPVRALFRVFTEALAGTARVELSDPAVQDALGALGYGQGGPH